ncbi:MAG: bifunctional riboflavin kinase/FAD synthetase [Lachnospiraceae bacterium]|nr:bifunctional riboflavin kinase/FAD synthetase [Lachnospiraceae bacterium]
MEILKEIPKLKNKNCVSIGKFDGVHLGHVTLLEELVLNSELTETESCVFTFDPYPEDFFSKKELPHLNTRGEIISQMEEIGVDRLICARFDEKLMNMSARDFVKNILVDRLNASLVVCGSDVSFGKDGAGDANLLAELSKEFGFETQIIDKIEYKNETISSSRIVKALEEGNMEDASEMLGYDYYHYGVVVKGKGLAHLFDMPTVNINPVSGRVIPKYGVYFTIVETQNNEEFHAVTNVGVRPTVGDENNVNIESHILDCPEGKDFYGDRIRVYFLKFLREERKFDSNKALFSQIGNDIIEAERFFKSI